MGTKLAQHNRIAIYSIYRIEEGFILAGSQDSPLTSLSFLSPVCGGLWGGKAAQK
jgi:hypothetical protein